MEIELKKKTYEELQQTLCEYILKSRAYEKVLDKAIELLDRNMLCENCPFPQNAECCTAEGCREYLRECLLKGE